MTTKEIIKNITKSTEVRPNGEGKYIVTLTEEVLLNVEEHKRIIAELQGIGATKIKEYQDVTLGKVFLSFNSK